MCAQEWCEVCGSQLGFVGDNWFGCLWCYAASVPNWAEQLLIDFSASAVAKSGQKPSRVADPANNVVFVEEWQAAKACRARQASAFSV